MFNERAFKYYESTVDNMVSICEPVLNLKGVNINCISYMKIYNDCRYLQFMNGYVDYVAKYCDVIKDDGKVFRTPKLATDSKRPYIFVWPDSEQDAIMSLLQEYNIWHGVSIYYRTHDGIESFSFCGGKEDYNLPNFIINNLDSVYQTIHYLKQKIAPLVNTCTKKDLGIYSSKFDFNYQESNNITYEKELIHPPKILSLRESQCLDLLCKGLTMKKIAQELQLSPRTVEEYINNVKRKTNTRYKNDLSEWYHNNNFIHSNKF